MESSELELSCAASGKSLAFSGPQYSSLKKGLAVQTPKCSTESTGGSVVRHVRGPRCPTYRPVCCLQALGRPVAKDWGAGATLATFRGLWSPFPRLGFEGGQGGWREVLCGQERGWRAELGGWCGSLESLGLSASPALFATCTVLVKISLIRKDGLLSP